MSSLGGRPVAAAVAGAACISSSAVVMQLAGSSPSATALGRCGFALPVLGALAWLEHRRGAKSAAGARTMARVPASASGRGTTSAGQQMAVPTGTLAERPVPAAGAVPADSAVQPANTVPVQVVTSAGNAVAAGIIAPTGTGPPVREGPAGGERLAGREGSAGRGAVAAAAAIRSAGAVAGMTARGRWLARVAGVLLAADLIVWSHSIADIGAGLGTVITNLQVVIVALLAWLVLGERPRRSLLIACPVMLGGLVLVGGLASAGGYGAAPGLGVAFGVGVAVLYSGYILLLRQAAVGAPVAATLFEATLGATAGSLVLGLLLRDFRLGPAWPALGWLVLLALTSQVLGWLLITVSMPRLPAWLVSALLLVQPAGSVLLGAVFLRERPSAAQLAGVAAMLGGVLIAARGKRAPAGPQPPDE